MRKFSLSIFGIIFYFLVNAQQLVSTSGGFAQLPQQSVSFSIGEALIDCYMLESITLSQGLLQPIIKPVTFIKDNRLEVGSIQVFPNPTFEMIHVKLGTKQPVGFNFILVQPGGNIVKRGNLLQSSSTISLSGISPGSYLLLINDQQNNTLEAIKIIKLKNQ